MPHNGSATHVTLAFCPKPLCPSSYCSPTPFALPPGCTSLPGGEATVAACAEIYTLDYEPLPWLPDTDSESDSKTASSSAAIDITNRSTLAAGWLPGIKALLGIRAAPAVNAMPSACDNMTTGKTLSALYRMLPDDAVRTLVVLVCLNTLPVQTLLTCLFGSAGA